MSTPDLGSGDFSALASLGEPEMGTVATGTNHADRLIDTDDWSPPTEVLAGLHGAPPPPPEPQSLKQAGLTDCDVEALLLKGLMHLGNVTGGQLAAFTCLSRTIVGEVLNALREELLVSIKASAGVHDFVFQLTDAGFQRARRHAEQCNYVGAAPVSLAAYETAIRGQSIQRSQLRLRQLADSLDELTLRAEFVSQLAQAINDGRGMFLYGPPGNGKTTLAERICDAFGQHIWIPQMVSIGGDLVRLYDPSCHKKPDAPQLEATRYDRRWVLIRRPTVVVGGELTLEQLDTRYNPAAGVSEAPVQLKANGG
ncbi:MAG: AAA family ATPase, partial [Planctomycetota bacterium]